MAPGFFYRVEIIYTIDSRRTASSAELSDTFWQCDALPGGYCFVKDICRGAPAIP